MRYFQNDPDSALQFYGVCNTCVQLHMQANGAADPWPREEVVAAIQALKNRLVRWDERGNTHGDVRFDNAVKEMIVATISFMESR